MGPPGAGPLGPPAPSNLTAVPPGATPRSRLEPTAHTVLPTARSPIVLVRDLAASEVASLNECCLNLDMPPSQRKVVQGNSWTFGLSGQGAPKCGYLELLAGDAVDIVMLLNKIVAATSLLAQLLLQLLHQLPFLSQTL